MIRLPVVLIAFHDDRLVGRVTDELPASGAHRASLVLIAALLDGGGRTHVPRAIRQDHGHRDIGPCEAKRYRVAVDHLHGGYGAQVARDARARIGLSAFQVEFDSIGIEGCTVVEADPFLQSQHQHIGLCVLPTLGETRYGLETIFVKATKGLHVCIENDGVRAGSSGD